MRRMGGAGSITAAGRCVSRSDWRSPTTARRTLTRSSKPRGPACTRFPVGPVHAGIIEPGHFRFHAGGEAVVRLEERLGYVHKGVDRLMRGASLERAGVLAARVSGDSTVAYAVAFARAVEGALGIDAPPRAHWLRGLMAELERIANHFGDIGAICNDASFALMHAHCGILRERTLRAAKAAFGHRLMMDAVVPGGVAVDLAPDGARGDSRARARSCGDFPRLVQLYDNTASLQDRTVGTGVLKADLARRFGAGGVVGRASGRDFDARRDHPYPPYDALSFKAPTRREGDVNARVWVRIDEVGVSLDLIEAILARLPGGPVRAGLPQSGAGEGCALVEAFRGDVFAHVRLARRRHGRPLPFARRLLVPMAAARSRNRGQHRRRLPAVQQIVQLLLLGVRP